MGIANKYNKTKVFDFSIPQDFKYVSLSELFQRNGKDKVYPVKAIYINKKSRYSDAPVVATDCELVNCPAHLTDTVKQMLQDDEVIEAVNRGKLGFTIYQYENKQQGHNLYFSINWVDM